MKRLKGFTLIEMVITIVVIIILSSISAPMYKKYTQQAKMAEAYVLLAAIRDGQKNYYQKYRCFLRAYESSAGGDIWTTNEEVLGIDARGNKYFTFFSICYRGESKSYFIAYAFKPRALISGTNTFLKLAYNLTSGQTIYEGSWHDD